MSPGRDVPSLFSLQGAAFEAAGRLILAPLTLDLAPGRIHGLVGPNGSGKSTLVKLLARQQPPAAGTVSLGGQAVDSLGDRAFARKVAYLPQFTPPAEGMTVRELASLGRFPWHGAFGRFGADDAAAVERALARTELARLAERLVDTLSGGERQRAWLAMMVAQDTGWLLLDEPTSALDIAHQVEVLAMIREFADERGVGVVVVLHDVNLAARFCDEIIALAEGRLVARGTADEIVTEDGLHAIYGIRMGILPHPGSGAPIGYVL